MPLRHKDTKISQRFKYQYYKLSEAFEPLCLCGSRRLFEVVSSLISQNLSHLCSFVYFCILNDLQNVEQQ